MQTNNQQYHAYITLYCSCCGHQYRIPKPCQDRFCPTCSYVRTGKIRRRIRYLVEKQYQVPGQDVRFLTLTIANQTNLDHMVRSLQRSFRRLRQRSFWKRKVTGGAFVIEITRPNNSWHAHVHAIIAGDFIPFKKLLEQWIQVSTGRGVYIKKIPKAAIIGYLTKYITKPDSSLSDYDKYSVSDSLKGTRLFQPFGTWHGWNRDFKTEKPACKVCGDRSGFITQWDLDRLSTSIDEVIQSCNSPPQSYQQLTMDVIPTYIDPF